MEKLGNLIKKFSEAWISKRANEASISVEKPILIEMEF